MKFDIFLSICQTEVDGYMPSEKVMFENFFDQCLLADQLQFGTAWVAETHLSCEIQKNNAHPVIPHFKGEIGLNTDILQMAQVVFSKTKNIQVGSAIRNILCNGGPLAHAEAIKTFLSLNQMARPSDSRKIEIGFASGRFEFSNRPYGIKPRNKMEQAAWPVLKGQILNQATEIFLRGLKGETFSSENIKPIILTEKAFRTTEDWETVRKAYESSTHKISSYEMLVDPYWQFEQVGVIPFEAPLENLQLTIGSHDPSLQELANEYLPVRVFNLSITPPEVIEQTHQRMKQCYHQSGGEWQRHYMPRTAMIFLDDTPGCSNKEKTLKAKRAAEKAWSNYWLAMEGTLDPDKVKKAVGNAIAGSPEDVVRQIKDKYHQEDRLMLWFDFNNHNNEEIKNSMKIFMEKVASHLS